MTLPTHFDDNVGDILAIESDGRFWQLHDDGRSMAFIPPRSGHRSGPVDI